MKRIIVMLLSKIIKHIFFFKKKKKKLTQLVSTRFKIKKFRKFGRDLTRNQEEIKNYTNVS